MTLKELEQEIPALLDYTGTMPEDIRAHARVKVHPPGGLIHQKDCELQYFGIVARGESRVINEFENGKVYMIETNRAFDFIGEVTLLANMPRTSVTIEAVTDCTVVYIPRSDAERWIAADPHILRKMAEHTAFKLYRSSYQNGLKLYYPPAFLLANHLVWLYEQAVPGAVALSDAEANGRAVTDAAAGGRPEPGAAQKAAGIGQNGTAAGFVFTLQRTRALLCEELGMNIKTLDRTIRAMQKDGYFNLVKGKICFDFAQYTHMKEYLSLARSD